MIAPVYEKFSQEHPELKFYKVDVDAQQQIMQECGIQAVSCCGDLLLFPSSLLTVATLDAHFPSLPQRE